MGVDVEVPISPENKIFCEFGFPVKVGFWVNFALRGFEDPSEAFEVEWKFKEKFQEKINLPLIPQRGEKFVWFQVPET